MKSCLIVLSLVFSSFALAHTIPADYDYKPALVDLNIMRHLNLPVLAKDEVSGVAYTVLTPAMEAQISRASHQFGRCGGFEALDNSYMHNPQMLMQEFQTLQKRVLLEQKYLDLSIRMMSINKNANIEKAISEVSPQNLQQWVTWLSSYTSRYNKAPTANDHVFALKTKIEDMMKSSSLQWDISTVDHNSTPQKSLRVRITGSQRPNEIIVLGGHLDSINQGFFGPNDAPAPGADDNASGSANLLETLRIVSKQAQPARTIEFFWYAGEESGLLGSAEIASSYKQAQKQVIAVLQLDMTLHPGDGEFALGSMEDFTSAWLREYLVEANKVYNLNLRILSDKCGYGCSDHASWYRQGYPTLMPFEATMSTMNRLIHTVNDKINTNSNFNHSAAFSKIALIFALDLANTTLRQPYGDSVN